MPTLAHSLMVSSAIVRALDICSLVQAPSDEACCSVFLKSVLSVLGIQQTRYIIYTTVVLYNNIYYSVYNKPNPNKQGHLPVVVYRVLH